MAVPVQRLRARVTTAALPFLKAPAGFFGGWSQSPAGTGAPYGRYLGPEPGAGQQAVAPAFAVVPMGTTHTLGVVQLLGDPLRRQDLPAGSWQIAFAAALANAAATYSWQGYAALFVVNGMTGGRRGTVFNLAAVGSGGRTVTTERSCFASIAGAAVAVLPGDYLCLELGLAVTNIAAALAPQLALYGEGLSTIGVDNAATTDARSELLAPVELLLSLPSAGEQPTPSVTHAQAVWLIKSHFPPNSGKLYDWDNPSSPLGHLIEWLADCIKLYGFDATDRLAREVSPLTCTELLPVWERCLGLSYSRTTLDTMSIAARRAAVIARLRETGPLTLFNVAAAVGPLAGYKAPDLAEVLEVQTADLRSHNLYTDTVPAGDGTIPLGTAFDGTNLTRLTPTLLDGGVVWPAGALLILTLSSANVSKLRVQLTGPDYTVASWEGGPDGLTTEIYLRSPAHAGKGIHGPWQLNLYRAAGAPSNTLQAWKLYVLGWTHGGRGQRKLEWVVYLDSSHQSGDRRAIEALFARVTQLYARSWVVYSKTGCYPGTDLHRPGQFLPG